MATQQQLRDALHYDPDTGVFTWLVRGSQRTPAGSAAGTVNKNGYVVFRFDGKLHYAHRLAWLYMTGEWPAAGVDHRDGMPGNNRWGNLREATQAQNAQNLPMNRKARAAPIGASFHKKVGKWRARIAANHRQTELGWFDSADAAHQAYLQAKSAMHTFNPTLRGA